MNPLVSIFVTQEKKFIDSCAEYFRKFDNLSSKMSGLDIAFKPTKIAYDPTKHIRATRLLVGVNINELPQIVKKDKYGYEDYIKAKAEGGQYNTKGGYEEGNPNLNEYNKIMNMDKQGIDNIQKPFSYEAYKAKTSSSTAYKEQTQVPFTMTSGGYQPHQDYVPKQQWNLKMNNNNSNDTIQKINEDVNVFNPYSVISLNSPIQIAKNSINPPNAFQNPYQSQMPIYPNSDFDKMNFQYMKYSNLPIPRSNTPADFPK